MTDDIAAVRAPIVGFTLTVADRQAAYVPVGHESGDAGGDLLSAASRPDQLELTTVLERLEAAARGRRRPQARARRETGDHPASGATA